MLSTKRHNVTVGLIPEIAERITAFIHRSQVQIYSIKLKYKSINFIINKLNRDVKT